MMRPNGFIPKRLEHMVCNLHKSIYGTNTSIKQSKLLTLIKMRLNLVCTRCWEVRWSVLVLYVEGIPLIGNDIGLLSSVNVWLSTEFQMNDLGEA